MNSAAELLYVAQPSLTGAVKELNGSDYTAVPLKAEDAADGKMEIGYIIKQKTVLSGVGELYIKELREYLSRTSD